MQRKKQRTKQTKEIDNHQIPSVRNNEKVTVQYIHHQSRRSVRCATPTNKTTKDVEGDTTQEELEIENIEYLDETPSVSVEDVAVEQSVSVSKVEEELEDPFYPNAIHCLLDLYKKKYNKTIMEMTEYTSNQNLAQIWHDIAKEMQESYFEFEAEQVQRKFSQLRGQYFDIKSMEDIENLDYFEELHSIYKDDTLDAISRGLKIEKHFASFKSYRDELLMRADLFSKSNENQQKEEKNINMGERETQDRTSTHQEVVEKTEKDHTITKRPKEQIDSTAKLIHLPQKQGLKRPIVKISEDSDEPETQKPKLEESNHIMPSKTSATIPNSATPTSNEITNLQQLNAEQERRHREHMTLLEKHFQQQTASIQQLNVHLQELIKRLPVAPST
ncbi:uncharacterized protein [Musca autumnalis]|uniref:uncharacterized protein n=1 Tax=Musca autumnalis TaxID=221902 RepID=UPI003CEE4720